MPKTVSTGVDGAPVAVQEEKAKAARAWCASRAPCTRGQLLHFERPEVRQARKIRDARWTLAHVSLCVSRRIGGKWSGMNWEGRNEKTGISSGMRSIQIDILTYWSLRRETLRPLRVLVRARARVHTHTRALARTHARAREHTLPRANTRSHARTHTPTHTHTHSPKKLDSLALTFTNLLPFLSRDYVASHRRIAFPNVSTPFPPFPRP